MKIVYNKKIMLSDYWNLFICSLMLVLLLLYGLVVLVFGWHNDLATKCRQLVASFDHVP